MSEQTGLEIAIVGMAGRYPGAADIPTFWSNIKAGVESISTFSKEELLSEGISPDLVDAPDYVRAGGVIADYDCFDAHLFGYAPAEAAAMDPQHRIFLECCWSALEDAGYRRESLSSRAGVFCATSLSTYLIRNILPGLDQSEMLSEWQVRLGNEKDHLSTRVAYKLNLTGPAMTVQTACSSSLVAVHYACQSLIAGDCDLALAGGVSIKVPHRSGYRYIPGFTLSPDGHCRTFDAKAQGTVPSSGCGVLVLKRLADAQAARDSIYCVIRGSAVNNDGASKVGYTAPSIPGQAAVIRQAHQAAAVTADTIAYIEAHGTGTQLGDPVEIGALTEAFGELPPKSCAIGSVKSNVGHTDVAAGVTGLIKTVLAVSEGVIPPSLHYQTPNPEIPFDHSPFFVASHCSEWPSQKSPRRAGVSSFGIGGTNAHAVLEEAGPRPSATHNPRSELLILSAHDPRPLAEQRERLAKYLAEKPQLSLGDVAFTLQVGRVSMPERLALVCSSVAEAADALMQLERPPASRRASPGEAQSVIFAFADASRECHLNVSELYDNQPVFRQELDNCAAILIASSLPDLRPILMQRQGDSGSTTMSSVAPEIWDAAHFAIEYGLARMWMSWGIQPAAVFGAGVGEYAAACLAGVFDVASALKLATMRGGAERAACTNLPSDLGREAARLAKAKMPKFPWISGVTGEFMDSSRWLDAEYWATQAHESLPKGAPTLLASRQNTLLLSLGPGTEEWNRLLVGSGCYLTSDVHPSRWADVLHTLGELWLAGAEPNWNALHAEREVGRVSLPTYAFERHRYWIDPPDKSKMIEQVLPSTQETSADAAQPKALTSDASSEAECAVAQVWADVFGLDQISVNDRFLELGGDSLLALKLVSSIQDAFHIRFALNDLWAHPTVAETALVVEDRIIKQIQESGAVG